MIHWILFEKQEELSLSSHSQPKEELLKSLSVSMEKGLSSGQAAELQQKYGPNKLKEKKKKTNLQRFLEQFKDVMIIILLIAAVISFVIACVEGEPMEFFVSASSPSTGIPAGLLATIKSSFS